MKAKTKKIVIGATAMTLVAGMAIGGTMAYLTKQTEKRANNFTFANGTDLDAMLTEPKWDGVIDYEYEEDGTITPIYEYKDTDNNPTTPDVPVYGYTDGDKTKPVTDKSHKDDENVTRPEKNPNTEDGSYGDEEALLMIPGQTAPKNPLITNTGVTDEWVAAKITFVYADGSGTNAGKALSDEDLKKVTDVMVIDYNGTDWTRGEGTSTSLSQEFYYNNIVYADATDGDVATKSIFNSVTLDKDATNEQVTALAEMGGFAIWIEGYAVQSTAFDGKDAWTKSASAVFNNTPTETVAVQVVRPGIVKAPATTSTDTGNTDTHGGTDNTDTQGE